MGIPTEDLQSIARILATGYAEQKKAVGFFELRVYTAQPGKRDALAARFASRTAAIFARHGITNVGYWIPQQIRGALAEPAMLCD